MLYRVMFGAVAFVFLLPHVSVWAMDPSEPALPPVDGALLVQENSASACCDCEDYERLQQAVTKAYKGVFYDNNYDYLCDPCYDQWYVGDRLKRRCLGDWGVIDFGGQYRIRQQSERNIRGLGLTGVDDDFVLHRTRLFVNTEIGDCFRFYGEMLDAVSCQEDFLPRPIEENRADIQNLFMDFKLLDNCDGKLWARAGRQELLYGAQRTISPLDWANIRRTFEGYKMFWRGQQWHADAFYVRPMNHSTNRMDGANQSQEFMGCYLTYKGYQTTNLDFYYLRYNNLAAPFEYDTLGCRWDGGSGCWLWSGEAAYQWGNYNNINHSAGAWTVGFGRKLPALPWNSTFWVYYDWASGSDTLNNGYDHLFPLAHKYLGFMDLYGRRNIKDLNLLYTMQPCKNVKLLAWYHIFELENRNDVPYSVTMRPFNPGNPPGSVNLGNELDLLMNWQVAPRLNLVLGYSHFFTGNYYRTTAGVPYDGDADLFYTQVMFNF